MNEQDRIICEALRLREVSFRLDGTGEVALPTDAFPIAYRRHLAPAGLAALFAVMEQMSPCLVALLWHLLCCAQGRISAWANKVHR